MMWGHRLIVADSLDKLSINSIKFDFRFEKQVDSYGKKLTVSYSEKKELNLYKRTPMHAAMPIW